jgi:hypothetical protein
MITALKKYNFCVNKLVAKIGYLPATFFIKLPATFFIKLPAKCPLKFMYIFH